MMFQTGNLKTSPAPKPKAEPPANATMVFGQSPVAAKPGAPVKPAAKAAEASPNATMVFGQSPLAPAKPVMPVAAKPAVARTTTPAKAVPMPEADAPVLPEPTMADPPRMDAAVQPEPTMADEPPQMEAAPEAPVQPEPTAADEPPQMEAAAEELPAEAAEEPMGDSGVQAEGAEESTEPGAAPDESTFDKAPPKGLFIGVAAGLAVLLLAGGALVAVKKLAKHPPPPAAVETLNGAQTEADKDTLASIASAEGKAKDALDVAGPKSSFPEGTALLARVEIQWADALNDEANALSAKNSDDPKVAELQTQAKAKVKSALDTLTQAFKADEKYKSSADMQLALADCFRAQHSNSNLNKALKVAQALKADDARLALVQGMASLQEDDGAEKAIPRLKVALAANPKSARVHYRLALAFQAMKDDANASTELKETMKISPQHERAKLALEAAASADGK